MNPWMPSCAGSKGNPSSGSTCRKWLPRPSSARGGLPAVRKHSQGKCPFAVAPVSSWPNRPSTDAPVDRQSTQREFTEATGGCERRQARAYSTANRLEGRQWVRRLAGPVCKTGCRQLSGRTAFSHVLGCVTKEKHRNGGLHSRSEGCRDTHPVLLRSERTPSGPAHGSLHTASGSHRSPRALGKAGM